MAHIPAELLPQLAAMGIVEPAACRWARVDAASDQCDATMRDCVCKRRRVTLKKTWLAHRNIFIGQCGGCRTVLWCDVISYGRYGAGM